MLATTVLISGCDTSSADGRFSVQIPSGWQPASGESTTAGAVLTLTGPTTEGVQAHFSVTVNGKYISLGDLPGRWHDLMSSAVGSGQFGELSNTTIAGESAIETTYALPSGPAGGVPAIHYLFVDHRGTTYIAAFSTDGPQFASLLASDGQKILASWKWLT